jgi:transposase-like protein
MAYAPERRDAVLKKMLPPNNISLVQLAEQENISVQTLYGWRAKARKEGRLMPDADLTPEGWTSRDKFAAVLETATMSEAEIGEYCRAKGLHTTQLAAWRAACEQANDWDQAASAEQRAYKKANDKKTKKLESELARKEKALAEVASLLVLRGKLDALYEKDGAE